MSLSDCVGLAPLLLSSTCRAAFNANAATLPPLSCAFVDAVVAPAWDVWTVLPRAGAGFGNAGNSLSSPSSPSPFCSSLGRWSSSSCCNTRTIQYHSTTTATQASEQVLSHPACARPTTHQQLRLSLRLRFQFWLWLWLRAGCGILRQLVGDGTDTGMRTQGGKRVPLHAHTNTSDSAQLGDGCSRGRCNVTDQAIAKFHHCWLHLCQRRRRCRR